MKQKKITKTTIIFLAIGILAGLFLVKVVLPSRLGVGSNQQIENRFIETVKTGPIPLAYHSLNNNDIRQLVGLLFPGETANITEELVQNIGNKLKELYGLQYEAALEEISSDEAMVEYLKKSGLLQEMGIEQEIALERIVGIDTTERYFESQSDYVEYYPIDSPSDPVRYPGEYEAIGAVFVSWPVYHDPLADWGVHKNLVSEIISEAEAWILVPNEYWQKAVELYLDEDEIDLSQIKFIYTPLNDIWVRDFGPITVLAEADNTPALIWNYYQPLGLRSILHDSEVGAVIGSYLDVPVYRLPVVIEGGNIITDGQGTVLMMESVFDNNPEINQSDLEQIAKDYLGAKRLVTFPIVPGEACGHIDMVAKFVDVDRIMVAQVTEEHPWHESLENMAATLADTDSANGAKYEIIRIQLPQTLLPVQEWTYLNSLTINNKVIVPTYGVSEDEAALQVYREAMPDYVVAGVNERSYAAGAVHCQTKEVPAALANKFIK
ncbi:agmatine deiminase family protein [Patescibacteria group bacterium]|nr:agmatine deiminase family protein [Patescibacteria group bacterium]MBU1935055.1 agmatine deiminase family protein [Patescibacteria group bacterium]